MNARPELSTVRAMDDCLVDVPLLDPSAARKIILHDVAETRGDETCPLGSLLGRVASADITSPFPCPALTIRQSMASACMPTTSANVRRYL
jgi:hypothetical protein